MRAFKLLMSLLVVNTFIYAEVDVNVFSVCLPVQLED